MKRTLLFTLLLLIGIFAFAGTDKDVKADDNNAQTLFGKNGIQKHWYVGMNSNVGQINKKLYHSCKISGAFIINDNLAVGITGGGLANDIYMNNIGGEKCKMEGGYGGLLIEPIISGNSLIHLTVPVIIGGGGIAYVSENAYSKIDDRGKTHYSHRNVDSDGFFVIEPGINAEINIMKYFKFGVGATYRYTSDINLIDTKKDILRGISAGFTLKVGKF